MKNILKKIIAGALILIGSFYLYHAYQHSHELVNLQQAIREYDQNHDQKLFDARKQKLLNYYTSGAYERDIENVCTNASKYFLKLAVKPDSLIIFDKDDTTLYHYQTRDDTKFIWEHQPKLMAARADQNSNLWIDPVIEPVLNFYNALKSHGFKIIFISSRNEGDYEHCLQELLLAGYKGFEKLILMPDKLAFDRNIKTAVWKLSVRKELAQKYTIVGNVGDRTADFEGGYNGYIVKLPQYII